MKSSKVRLFGWPSDILVILRAGWKPDCSTFCALIQGEKTAEKILEHWDKMLEMNIELDLR